MIDLYLVRLFNQGKNFVNVDPQMIINYEQSTFSAVLESTIGFVVSKENGLTVTLTPGFPIGGTRPYDWTIKSGIKKLF